MLLDRISRTKPAFPGSWPVGTILDDPTFGSRQVRITDGNTLPGNINRSHQPPSASHQLAWNKNSTMFYTLGPWKCVPWVWNPNTMQASRIAWPGSGSFRINDGGLVINSVALEPQFSWVDNNLIYFCAQTGNWPILSSYNFANNAVTTLLDVTTIPHLTLTPQSWWEPGNTVGYLGAIYSSEQAPERIATFFGGDHQDHHQFVAIFDVGNPSNIKVIDTKNSLIYINGATPVATAITLNFLLHHSQIDRTGRYITLEPTSTDISLGKSPKYIVDLVDNSIVPLDPYPWAHTVMGWNDFINQDFPGVTPYDNAQWSYRTLADIAHPRQLVRDPTNGRPLGEQYCDGHTSWNNALAGSLQPVLSELYRVYDGPNDVIPHNNTPWQCWDDEIISIEVENSGATTKVWRHCHHHAIVRDNIDSPGSQPFQYQPRPNISPNGRWAFYGSNGDRSLGTDSVPSGNSTSRTDVFMVELLYDLPVPLPRAYRRSGSFR